MLDTPVTYDNDTVADTGRSGGAPLDGRNIQLAERLDEPEARNLVVGESVSGDNRSLLRGEPDRLGLGDQVTNCENESVRADHRPVADALGSQDRGREGLVRDLRMHEHDRP